MNEVFDAEAVRKYWTEQALLHGQSPSASWSDQPVIEAEVRTIVERLNDGDHVLDIGCANGWSSVQWALKRRVQVRGIDYIPEMIAQARQRALGLPDALKKRVEFAVGDITKLDERDDAYNKLVVIRVVINLSDWNRQRTALRECCRVMKPGGLLLLSEATKQGWERLNKLRVEWDLSPIPMPPFNLYVDQDQVIEAVAPELELVELSNFASTYYVGSRVLKPLLIRALGSKQDVSDPTMEWNRWFAQLPPAGDYGTQKLFVFRKK
jgi:ubiquinone/menaquinone biosynthesis C-methylase UbiE